MIFRARLFLLPFLILVVYGCAQKNAVPISPSSLVIEGLKFYFSNSIPSQMVIESSGTGDTQEEAVRQALVSAVGQAMGVLVVSETSVADDKLIEDLAATYASGKVTAYSLKTCSEGVRTTCSIRATVRPWSIRDELITKARSAPVDGKNLYAEFLTQREATAQRIKLTKYYLTRVSSIGLEPRVHSVVLLPDSKDFVRLKIRYTLEWNDKFRDELIDFLKMLGKDTGGDKVLLGRETQLSTDVFIRWGTMQGVGPWSQMAVIRTFDQSFAELVYTGLYRQRLSYSLEPFGICDHVLPDDGILMFARSGYTKDIVVNVSPDKVQGLQSVSIRSGCKTSRKVHSF